MIKILYCGGSSACFELDGGAPYYAKESYRVLVDGEERASVKLIAQEAVGRLSLLEVYRGLLSLLFCP